MGGGWNPAAFFLIVDQTRLSLFLVRLFTTRRFCSLCACLSSSSFPCFYLSRPQQNDWSGWRFRGVREGSGRWNSNSVMQKGAREKDETSYLMVNFF